MPRALVQPNGWAALRLPNETVRLLQVVPNTTISLGKYGSFPSNLIIERPFHLTYEIQDKRDDESFSRLRVVPAAELNAEALADADRTAQDGGAEEDVIAPADGEEMTLVDEDGKVLARSNRETIDGPAKQTLTMEEIELLKREGSAAGKDLIAKLMLSHTAIDQKTAYSLAKYKLLKTKKYIRQFTVLPVDVGLLGQWVLDEKDPTKVLEIRQEMLALIGCWADVHFAGIPRAPQEKGGRWMVVDETGGLLVAAMAERMGFLHHESEYTPSDDATTPEYTDSAENSTATQQENGDKPEEGHQAVDSSGQRPPKRPRQSDFDIPYASSNTLTLIHSNTQPNLSLLSYFGFDSTDPDPPLPYHPLFTNIKPMTWLQLVDPASDPSYASEAPDVTPEVLASWKSNRRGNYHRKRRRWARTRHIVDDARTGGFLGLAVASPMDPVSVLRNTLPYLAGGAPVAIFSPSIEPLAELADCFSVSRRAAWVSNPPEGVDGKSLAELERWEGTEEFPINPTLLLGASIQSSRAMRWQVLPGRTHPYMMARGGAEGYLFTAWRAVPVEGRIEARGKYKRRKTAA